MKKHALWTHQPECDFCPNGGTPPGFLSPGPSTRPTSPSMKTWASGTHDMRVSHAAFTTALILWHDSDLKTQTQYCKEGLPKEGYTPALCEKKQNLLRNYMLNSATVCEVRVLHFHSTRQQLRALDTRDAGTASSRSREMKK